MIALELKNATCYFSSKYHGYDCDCVFLSSSESAVKKTRNNEYPEAFSNFELPTLNELWRWKKKPFDFLTLFPHTVAGTIFIIIVQGGGKDGLNEPSFHSTFLKSGLEYFQDIPTNGVDLVITFCQESRYQDEMHSFTSQCWVSHN